MKYMLILMLLLHTVVAIGMNTLDSYKPAYFNITILATEQVIKKIEREACKRKKRNYNGTKAAHNRGAIKICRDDLFDAAAAAEKKDEEGVLKNVMAYFVLRQKVSLSTDLKSRKYLATSDQQMANLVRSRWQKKLVRAFPRELEPIELTVPFGFLTPPEEQFEEGASFVLANAKKAEGLVFSYVNNKKEGLAHLVTRPDAIVRPIKPRSDNRKYKKGKMADMSSDEDGLSTEESHYYLRSRKRKQIRMIDDVASGEEWQPEDFDTELQPQQKKRKVEKLAEIDITKLVIYGSNTAQKKDHVPIQQSSQCSLFSTEPNFSPIEMPIGSPFSGNEFEFLEPFSTGLYQIEENKKITPQQLLDNDWINDVLR